MGKTSSRINAQRKQGDCIKEQPLPYQVYGVEGIEPGALNQMKIAAQLPVATGAALMPDAHQGYGLPIGGVLATENAVIPYAVGCRHRVSDVYDHLRLTCGVVGVTPKGVEADVEFKHQVWIGPFQETQGP